MDSTLYIVRLTTSESKSSNFDIIFARLYPLRGEINVGLTRVSYIWIDSIS